MFPHIKFENLYSRLISLVVDLNSLKNELKYISYVMVFIYIKYINFL